MRTKEDFAHQNEYNKSKYDSITMQVTKGFKKIWKEEAEKRNLSLTAFIQKAVTAYIEQTAKEDKSNV